MSHRLAAVTGSRNPRVYRPYAEWKAHGINDEIDFGTETLNKYLQKACDENGCRKLELDTCVFNDVDRINVPGFDGAPAPTVEELETLAALETMREGNMSLTEVNV